MHGTHAKVTCKFSHLNVRYAVGKKKQKKTSNVVVAVDILML